MGRSAHLHVETLDDVEKVLLERIAGPCVEMDKANFERIRRKFREGLESRKQER
jgi:hypothetical protein